MSKGYKTVKSKCWCVCVHMSACTVPHGSPGTGVTGVYEHPMWEVGTELVTSRGAASALNC